MFDNNVQYEITLTNNSGVDYREWQTGSSVAIGQTLVFTVAGENLANTIMSNVAQHNALRGRTEIVANAVALGGSSGGGGTVSYPSFTGNADKVLTVNATEDDVEWTAAVTQVYVDTQDSLLQDQINLKADAIAVSQSLDTKADVIAVNQVLSTKADLVGGVIPSSQLPSYVDDVLNFPDLVSFPVVGEGGKIYIAEDVNKTYRWGGSSYIDSGGGGVALGETSSTAYRGDNGKIAYDHSQSQGNPHNTTTSAINEGTKLFFTEDRVRQTVLTGMHTGTASNVLASDRLIAAIGKLQAQIFNIAPPPIWVSAASIGTVHASLTGMEFAKINGNLWVRGRYQSVNTIANGTILFTLTSIGYRIETPEATISDLLIGQVQVNTAFTAPQYLDLLCMLNPKRYCFILRAKGAFDPVSSPNYAVIQPTPIGKLLSP